MITLAVIGCGSIGERHLRCFQKTGRARLIAVDSDQDKVSGVGYRLGIPSMTHWQELLDTDCDAAVIATPAHLHGLIARNWLNSGRHVLIEKPLVLDINEAALLLASANSSPGKAAVAYIQRFNPVMTRLKVWLDEHLPGAVRLAHIFYGQHFPSFRPGYAQTYFSSRGSGGGIIQDGLTHLADLANWMLGPGKPISALCSSGALPGVDVEDTVLVQARHRHTLVSFSANLFQAPNEFWVECHGDELSVRAESHLSRLLWRTRSDKDWQFEPIAPWERDDQFVRQAHAFLDLVEGKESYPLATLQEGSNVVSYIDRTLKLADATEAY